MLLLSDAHLIPNSIKSPPWRQRPDSGTYSWRLHQAKIHSPHWVRQCRLGHTDSVKFSESFWVTLPTISKCSSFWSHHWGTTAGLIQHRLEEEQFSPLKHKLLQIPPGSRSVKDLYTIGVPHLTTNLDPPDVTATVLLSWFFPLGWNSHARHVCHCCCWHDCHTLPLTGGLKTSSTLSTVPIGNYCLAGSQDLASKSLICRTLLPRMTQVVAALGSPQPHLPSP